MTRPNQPHSRRDRAEAAQAAKKRAAMSVRFMEVQTELMHSRAENIDLANAIGMDAKFNVKNRKSAETHLEKMCTHVLRDKANANRRHVDEKPKPFVVIFYDLDLFKQVNDTHGHEVGDDVLRAVISCVKSSIRGSDELFRLGGDEFLLVLDNNNCGIETACRIKDNLDKVKVPVFKATRTESGKVIKEPVLDDNGNQIVIAPTISTGIYPHNPATDPSDVEYIVTMADMAMYAAKGNDDPDGKKQGRIAYTLADGAHELIKTSPATPAAPFKPMGINLST